MLRIYLAKGRDGLLCEAISEVFPVGTRPNVFKRQYADSYLSGGASDLMRDRMHLGNEAVPSAGNGRDIPIFPAAFAQYATQGGDVLVEVILFHDGVGPNGAKEFFFLQHLSLRLTNKSRVSKTLGVRAMGSPARERTSLRGLSR